jgi:hypothetical protein
MPSHCWSFVNRPRIVHGSHAPDRLHYLQLVIGGCLFLFLCKRRLHHFLCSNRIGILCLQTNKSYQAADWRKRPLPARMLAYARTDTHYLLYVADRLRQMLLSIPPEKVTQLLANNPLPRMGPQVCTVLCRAVYELGHGRIFD